MMKQKVLGKWIVGLAALLGMSGLALASTTDAEASTLYRAYNPNTGEHLYTQNGNEIPFVVKAGWRNEGTAWDAPSQGAPVYRMFNPNRGGDHHFTMNTHEVNMLKSKGWRYEGESWKSGGSTPVYRLYNPNARSGAHHFTIHAYERDNLKRKGWRYEGIAFYSGKDQATPKPPKPAPTPTEKVIPAPDWTKDYPQHQFGTWYENQDNGMLGQFPEAQLKQMDDLAQKLLSDTGNGMDEAIHFNGDSQGNMIYHRWDAAPNKYGRWTVNFYK